MCVSVQETEAMRGKGIKKFRSSPNCICQTQPPPLICQLLTKHDRPDPVLFGTWAQPLHWCSMGAKCFSSELDPHWDPWACEKHNRITQGWEQSEREQSIMSEGCE